MNNNLQSLLLSYRQDIISELKIIEKKVLKELLFENPTLKIFYQDLFNFSTKGKMLRGAALMHAYKIYGGTNMGIIRIVGAALELFYTCVLIQDDLMDNSDIRRGEPSFHKKYQQYAREMGVNNDEHYGRSMAIDGFAVGYFLSFQLLSELSIDKDVVNKALALFAKEMAILGQAQAEEYIVSQSSHKPTLEEILKIYTYKTAHYTLSVPLMMGAVYAKASNIELRNMEEYGELVGVIFQIKDDELDIFANSDDTGKPVGSDISENKKTILRHVLFSKMSSLEKKQVEELYGKNDISPADINLIRNFCEKYDIENKLHEMCLEYARKARNIIKKCSISDDNKQILNDFIQFNISRVR